MAFEAARICLLSTALSTGTWAQPQPAFTELISPDVQAGGGFGYDFGGLPDLTGDGVGEFYATQFKTYVYDGKSLALLYSFGDPCTYGHVQSAGDLTGDEIPDLMAPKLCDARGTGPVEFLDGKNARSLFQVNSPRPVNQGFFGETLRLLPDMTGDGKGDWLIHQPEFESGVGRVYIFDSQTHEVVLTIQNTETANRFHMRSVEIIPDVDGDGQPELLVGAMGASVSHDGQNLANAGRVVVRSLQTGAALFELLDPEPQAGGGFGFAFSGIGDSNDDGLPDIAVGTFTKDSFTGAIYLFSGKDGHWLRTVRSPNPSASGRFGRKIISLPDVNGDGVPDFWTQEDGLQRTHVFDGATSAVLKTIAYPGVFAKQFFIDVIPQGTSPGVRGYLFGSEFVNNSEGRVYFLPYTHIGRPRLTALGRSPTGFRFELLGELGDKLEIQASDDLTSWNPITSITLGNRAVDVEDPVVANGSQRFYRALQGE